MIPFNDLRGVYTAHKGEIDAAVARVLESGWYILGAEVTAFEREFAAFCGAAECVGVNSGTDALALALAAVGVGPGDEVITVTHTAVATVAAIAMLGATPVLVDVEAETLTMDPAAAARAITPRTRAIVPVHLYGHPADLDPVLAAAGAAGIPVIEDCAQAHGATYKGRPVGTLGSLGCFSFYPTKNLGAFGDGGAVIGSDAALIERVRLQREYGWTPAARYVSMMAGRNSRLDELQAAILRVRLRHLTEENERRRALAALYAAELGAGITLPPERPACRHVYHLYVVRVQQRDALRERLAAAGVGTAIHYPVPVHLQPAYAGGGVVAHDLAVSERAAGEILSLPIYPHLSDEQARAVAAALNAACAQPPAAP